MNYTIKEFIESNKFPKMQLISDNSGINRVIRGVQILSVPNMEKFLGGGELLLTSLVVYENQLNERIVLTHLEELNKKQVSGLIIQRIMKNSFQTFLHNMNISGKKEKY